MRRPAAVHRAEASGGRIVSATAGSGPPTARSLAAGAVMRWWLHEAPEASNSRDTTAQTGANQQTGDRRLASPLRMHECPTAAGGEGGGITEGKDVAPAPGGGKAGWRLLTRDRPPHQVMFTLS